MQNGQLDNHKELHMKRLFILAVLFTFPGVGFGQGAALDNEVDSELDQLYTAPTTAGKKAVATQNVQAPQPIYILNQATPTSSAQATNTSTQTAIQKQPTTFVEASPMVESKADQMKKNRVDAEAQTETKIVEKLEQSRLDDEKRRADVLFGSKFDQLTSKSAEVAQPAPVIVPAPVPVQVIQPTPVQVVTPAEKIEKESLTRDAVREEINAALKAEQEADVTAIEQRYFNGLVGFPDYPDATNVKGNYSLGASFGTKYDDTYAVEGSFIYSNYTMNPVYYNGYVAPNMDVNQYAASLGMKYFMFTGMVKPFLGGLVQYNYRTYNWKNNGYGTYYNSYNNNSGTSTNSHAIDLGLNVGADVVFNGKFTVGVDYRYFFNLSSRRDNSAFVYQPYYGTALEQLNASLLSLSAKVQF